MKMNVKVGVLMALAVTACALGVRAGIDGSKHDFQGASWRVAGTAHNDICQPCHTPHNAQDNQLVPLWNHSNSLTATFQVYTSLTLDATVGQPDGESLACLSCHDGSVALNAYGGGGGGDTMGTVNSAKNVGTDLRNDHPVSFAYPSVADDPGLHDATNALVAPLLFGGKVQCASCHDVHNGGAGSPSNLLVKSNVGSALCLTCHDK